MRIPASISPIKKIAAVSLVKRITAAKLIGESLSESFKNLRGYNRVLSEQHLLRGGNVGDNGAFSRSLSRDRFVQMLCIHLPFDDLRVKSV